MISPRFALPVALMLAVALVPTVIHSYIGLLEDDGISVAAIPEAIGTYSSEPGKRSAQWVKEVFDAEDWSDRIYRDPNGNKVRLFVARSYDHKRLYHHPELALSYGQRLESVGVKLLANEQQVAVHLLRDPEGPAGAAYVLVYDGATVKSPVKHQIIDSLNLLLNGRKQMTIFYAADLFQNNEKDFSESAGASVLLQAVQDFLSPANM